MTTPEEFMATAHPTIGILGSAFYFVPETLERGKALGLDGFRFYFLGRGGVLGDVEAPVVKSAFGYFESGLLATMWDSARETVSPRDAARAFIEAAHAYGQAHFAGQADLAEFCQAAETMVAACDPTALPLFAGVAAEPLPDDLAARAVHLTMVLREFRGSAHLLSVVASGVDPLVAHYFRRPDDFQLFGYQAEEVPELTTEIRERLAQADALTDTLCLPAYAAVDAHGREAILVGLERMEAALALGA
jgi:hypothetical protein